MAIILNSSRNQKLIFELMFAMIGGRLLIFLLASVGVITWVAPLGASGTILDSSCCHAFSNDLRHVSDRTQGNNNAPATGDTRFGQGAPFGDIAEVIS